MSEPIRNAAIDLIDHQVGLMTGSRLVIGELKHNVVAPMPRMLLDAPLLVIEYPPVVARGRCSVFRLELRVSAWSCPSPQFSPPVLV
jgi:hypothetical protein